MAESFNARYCCIHCLVTRQELQQKIGLDQIEQRTNSTFYQFLDETPEDQFHSQNFLTQTKGVYRKSELCRLRYLKIPESIAVDVFHDIDEGFGKDVFTHMTNLLVQSGQLSEEELSDRILNFDFGILDISMRPTNATHFSGIQMRNLLYRFNFLFYDKANYTMFEPTSLVSKILQILHSNRIKASNINILRQLITRLKTIWGVEMSLKFKPKAHFLEHYADIIEKVGPLVLCDTAAYEMHHRILTRVIEKNPQFVNIMKSCAVRHQLAWASKWKNGKFYTLKITGKGIKKKINMENVVSFPTYVDWSKEVHEVPKASYIYDYMKDLFVVQPGENRYNFYQIEAVIVFLENEMIYLKCKEVKTQYNGFFAAHKIISEPSSTSVIIDVKQLEIKESFAIIRPFRSDERYILCKRNVI